LDKERKVGEVGMVKSDVKRWSLNWLRNVTYEKRKSINEPARVLE